MKNKKANILVIEDDMAICRGLLDVLVFNGYEAEGSFDGKEGFKKGLEGKYDLIMLDVMLPNMDGFTICGEIRKKKPKQPIIMITAKGSEDDIIAGFKAGADDYVPKPFSLRELMVRVEAILRRSGKNIGDEQIEYLGIFFDGKTLNAKYQGQIIEMTRREMDIIFYLYKNNDRIVSKKELLSSIWGYQNPDIETRTVDIHMLKLRKKIIDLTNIQSFIATIRGEGYRLEL
ncbi:MAG: response regulator transcription factor [Desulfobacterales bacterium]|nr:response regulator transcription factor [Desulfobacterales bacterium]